MQSVMIAQLFFGVFFLCLPDAMAALVFIGTLILLSALLKGIETDFFVVLFQRGQILTSLGELALLHAFADVPAIEMYLAQVLTMKLL